MSRSLTLNAAIKETWPTVFGYLGIGMAFGIVGKGAGLSFGLLLSLSIFVYAGSAQFIIISMLLTKSPVLSIMLATFLVNARMLLISLTIAPYVKHESMVKNILLGIFLTDESFALGMNKLSYTDRKLSFTWLNGANLISYLTWSIATALGVLVAQFIGDPRTMGIDFAIVSMFIGLLYFQLIADKSLSFRLQSSLIVITAILVYIGMIIIPSTWLILSVTLVGCSIGMVIKHVFA
ncbi:AzlC family ABC transporter permease [Enterococcus bulliens]